MMRKVHGWAVVMGSAAIGLAGCGSSGGATHAIGDSAFKAAVVVAQADQPVDAAPSPDGNVIYFVATGERGPGIFSVAGGGGTVSTVVEGAPFAEPTGVAVATDGSRVYVADQQAQKVGTTGAGAIVTVPANGALESPTLLTGTGGRSPRGLDVVNQGDADAIFFTGLDPANGAPGLFQVPAIGGTVLTVAEGAPFVSPDSVVVDAEGAAYVSDQGSGPGQGKVFRVAGGTVTPVLGSLHLGAPAGVTLIHDDATLLVSSLDATSLSDQVLFLDLATGKTATASKIIGQNNNSSGGLHRAHTASVLAWADVSRSGRVYRVEP